MHKLCEEFWKLRSFGICFFGTIVKNCHYQSIGQSDGQLVDWEALWSAVSINQVLQLENRKLQSDVDTLQAEDHNKEQKLQKLQWVWGKSATDWSLQLRWVMISWCDVIGLCVLQDPERQERTSKGRPEGFGGHSGRQGLALIFFFSFFFHCLLSLDSADCLFLPTGQGAADTLQPP